MRISVIREGNVGHKCNLMPNDAMMSIDVFQDHRGSNDLNRYAELFIEFPYKRIPPTLPKLQPPAKMSDAFDASIVILNFTGQQETVPPHEAERFDFNSL